MNAIDEETVHRLDQLINKERDFKEALLIGEDLLDIHKEAPILRSKISAEVWFRLALAATLSKKDPATFEELARNALDYTPIMEGDLLRDRALQEIRQGHTFEADMLIPEIFKLHEGDQNRVAALYMVRGRIENARANLKSARWNHKRADLMWQELGDKANQQWIANNLFAWLRVLIWLKDPERHEVYNHFMAIEPSDERKRVATTLMRFGRPAVMAFRIRERLAS